MSGSARDASGRRRTGAALACALLFVACSTTPVVTGEPSSAPGTTGPGSSIQGPAGTATAGSLPPGLVVGSGPFIASDTAAGLAELTSYRARLSKSFEGTVAGAAQSWSSTIELRVAGGATHLTVATTGTGALETPGDLYEINGVVYDVGADGACIGGLAEGAGAVRTTFEPAAQLSAVVGGDPAGEESVNGVAATHVTFDERAVGMAGLGTARGELWSATAGGYLVRYTLRSEGGSELFGDGTSGTETWQYELTDINQPMAIDLPGECPAGKVGTEPMSGATDVLDVPGLLTFQVAASIADVIAFYESRAPEAGWTRLQEPLINDELGVLELSSTDGPVTVIVRASGGGLVSVYVAMDRGE